MAEGNPNYATPSSVRSITSYPARRGYKQAVDPAQDSVVGVMKDSRTRLALPSSHPRAA